MAYVQGSETVREITSKTINSPAEAPIRCAGPPVHAVPKGATFALCGQPCPHVFDGDPWERGFGGGDNWCPRCEELAPRS